jgi:hypothetical protein
MIRRWQPFYIVILIAASLPHSLNGARQASSSASPLRFDSRWWQHADSDEQQGFVYGYMDCRQPSKTSKASIVEYQIAVSEMMKSQEATGAKAVAKAIEQAWRTLPSRSIQGGEQYRGSHGFLDGEWWGSFEGRPWPSNLADADRGYVEGYLACGSAHTTPRAVQRYQGELNRHYASGRHQHDKVADVLSGLRNSSTSPR